MNKEAPPKAKLALDAPAPSPQPSSTGLVAKKSQHSAAGAKAESSDSENALAWDVKVDKGHGAASSASGGSSAAPGGTMYMGNVKSAEKAPAPAKPSSTRSSIAAREAPPTSPAQTQPPAATAPEPKSNAPADYRSQTSQGEYAVKSGDRDRGYAQPPPPAPPAAQASPQGAAALQQAPAKDAVVIDDLKKKALELARRGQCGDAEKFRREVDVRVPHAFTVKELTEFVDCARIARQNEQQRNELDSLMKSEPRRQQQLPQAMDEESPLGGRSGKKAKKTAPARKPAPASARDDAFESPSPSAPPARPAESVPTSKPAYLTK
jgi:hypothetical protein